MTLTAPTPAADRYACICLDPGERLTGSGLILPGAHSQKMMRWLIVAAGPGKWSADGSRRLKPQFKVGDVVMGLKLTTYERIPGCALSMNQPVWIIAEDKLMGPVQDLDWNSVPEVADWRTLGPAARWPGTEAGSSD